MTGVTLCLPSVRFASTGESQFDAMTTWRAELEMCHLREDDSSRVLGGHADFVIIRIGEHPIGDLLDSLSGDAEHFASLFDDDDVAGEVQDQFDDAPFNRVLIISTVIVAAPLRGHNLGAWLVAEIVDAMASPIDTLVLLYPHPLGASQGSEVDAEAVAALSRYWRRVGLTPIEDHPEFLGQATAYRYLPDARAGLRKAAHDVAITVAVSQIREEPPAERRCVVVSAAAKVDAPRLHVVRDDYAARDS